MKSRLIRITAVILLLSLFTGCSAGNGIPDKWYEETIEYYRNGIKNGWTSEKRGLELSEYLRERSDHFGYLLTDLDGDGADELLIGIIDGSEETKFTDLIVYHRDLKAWRLMSAGGGCYIYLCDNNVIRFDSSYGSQIEKKYYTYNSAGNSFTSVSAGSLPRRFELKEF